jgi:adenosylhomocysteine nucleosidase
MNADIALIMALPNESKGLFEQAGIDVHYSGIGKINAAFKAFEVIQKTGCKTLINLGSAGSSHFDAHSLVEVITFVQRDMDVSPLGFAVGVTPMDDEIPAEIILSHILSFYPKGFVVRVIRLKQGSKVSCNLSIWKPML